MCVWLEVMKWYRWLLSQLRPSPIHFAVFLRMCTSQPLCLCRIVGSSQTPGVFHAGGGSLTTDKLRLFRKEQQKGEIEWRDCILMFATRNLKNLALAHDGICRGQRMNLQQSLTTTRIRTSRKTSLTGQGLKNSPCWPSWVIGRLLSCRHNCWPVRIEAGVTSKEMKEKQQKT